MNRNQFFMAGIIVFMLGLQLRWVESYTLTENCTKFLAKRFLSQKRPSISQVPVIFATQGEKPIYRHTIKPPTWLGWAVLCTGGVFILHSLAMPKPS